MKHCLTCTCSPLLSADELLSILTHGQPEREVYRGANSNRWFVTYSGGETSFEAVQKLVQSDKVKRKYSNCDSGFYVGETIDIQRSTFTKHNRKIVYVTGSLP